MTTHAHPTRDVILAQAGIRQASSVQSLVSRVRSALGRWLCLASNPFGGTPGPGLSRKGTPKWSRRDDGCGGLRARAISVVVLTVAMVIATPALAVQPDEILKDATLEARARSLSHGLRCLVCQNQSIDDSDAPLARDLRLLVRERLTAGDSDEAVIQFVVSRFGDFVLLKPPLRRSTLLLWLMPLLIFSAALWTVLSSYRAQQQDRTPAAAKLTAKEEAALSKALGKDQSA